MKKKSEDFKDKKNEIKRLCGGFSGNDIFKKKLLENNLPSSTGNTYYKAILIHEVENHGLNKENIENRLDELLKLDTETLNLKIKNKKVDTINFKTQEDINKFMGEKYSAKYISKRLKIEQKQIQKQKQEEERQNQRQKRKEENRIKIEKKIGIFLKDKKWFKCTIEEIKYSTFQNRANRNYDYAYVVVYDDRIEIYKESAWLKTNMGSRKLYYSNITSIDYDARGKFHLSSGVVINTKSAEHVQLKRVGENNYNLMNDIFSKYLDELNKPNNKTTSNADELMKYAELFEKGLLTKEEYENKKKELL